MTASADSTGEEEENCKSVSAGGPPSSKRSRKANAATGVRRRAPKDGKVGKRDSRQQMGTSASGIPFVKHHHSVKKPQTPSVSRR